MNIITFSELRTNLKQVMDTACDEHEPTIIRRANGDHMILTSLHDYESLKETAYLLSTEANATRLRRSLAEFKQGKTKAHKLIEP